MRTPVKRKWRNAVSILNRLRLSAHLDDAGLAAIWTDEATSGIRQAHPHLASCPACRTRFAAAVGMAGRRADRRDHRSRRAFFRRATGGSAVADFPPTRSGRAAGARHRVPSFCPAVDVSNVQRLALDCRCRCRRAHRRCRRWPVDGSAPPVYAASRANDHSGARDRCRWPLSEATFAHRWPTHAMRRSSPSSMPRSRVPYPSFGRSTPSRRAPTIDPGRFR